MSTPTALTLSASGPESLLSDPQSLFTTLVVLLVVWYAWSRVTAAPDLERAKRVYEEEQANRDDDARRGE